MRAWLLKYLIVIYISIQVLCMALTYFTGNYSWMWSMGGLMVGFTIGILATSQDNEKLPS